MSVRSFLLEKGIISPHQAPNSSGEFRITCPECSNPGDKCYVNGGNPPRGVHCKHCHLSESWRQFKRRFEPPSPQEVALEKFVSHCSETLFNPAYTSVLGYLTSRGFTEEFVRELRLGVCLPKHMYEPTEVDREIKLYVGDNWFLQNRIVIPYLDGGSVVTVRGRILPGLQDDRKYLSLTGSKPELYIPVSIDKSRPVTVTEGECLPGQTEVLSPTGWVTLESGYSGPVVVLDREGNLVLETPICRIEKENSEELIRWRNSRTFSHTSTQNHNIVLYHKKKQEYIKREAKDLPHDANLDIVRSANYIPKPESVSGISLDELSLMIAFSADGTVDVRKNGDLYCRFGFKKQRKVYRIINILKNLNIPFSGPSEYSDGLQGICFRVPERYKYLIVKEFPHDMMLTLSSNQRNHIIDEIPFWDGNFVKNRNQIEYSSKIFGNCTFIQTISHLSGYISTIRRCESALGIWYKVSVLFSKQYTNTQSLVSSTVKCDKVYCLQMPSGTLLIRQDSCIQVTGNCDAMILAQHGEQVIGLPGSGTSEANLEKIREYPQIFICFDPDEAGIRGADKLVSHLPEARRVDLPEGYDVNEYIKSFGYDSYTKLRDSSILYEDGKPQPNDNFGHVVDEYANWAWSNGTSLGPEIGWAPRMQECLSGLAPGLYLFGATAASGKTRFLHKLLYELCIQHPEKVVCVSLTLDDSLNRTVQMVHSLHSQISFNLLSTPKKLEGDVLKEYFASLDSMKEINNLIIRDVKYGRSLRYIRKFLGTLHKKHKDKKIIIVLDSLASVSPEGQFDDDAEEYSVKSNFKAFLSRELSYMSRKYDMAIITPTDLRKLQGHDRPTELDLKDAAELAYNADFTMFAYNDVKQNGNTAIMTWNDDEGNTMPIFELYIDKNRSTGKKQLIRFKMDGDHCDFEECTQEEELYYDSLLNQQRMNKS